MKKPAPIDKKRQEIDDLDLKILSLLNQRAAIAKEIGKIKEKNGESVYALDREREILNRMMEKSKGALPAESVEDIFSTILTACRSLQKRLQIAFMGPEATFTHQAAISHFGRNAEYTPLPSIKDVFVEVEANRADYGVVPIENSTEGVVNHTLDMFIDSDLVIVAERQDRISQFLLSLSGNLGRVRTIYSHYQALAQCRKWIEAHVSGVSIVEAKSTSDAAVQATLDASCAAIASELAGKMYHLKTVASNIEDIPDNATRFLIIGKKSPAPTGHDKTSILFSIKDRVGALFEMLKPFRENKINLTKIESRPTKKKAWEYIFFVDFIGHQSEDRVKKALADLYEQCKVLKILGSYPYRS